MEIKKVIQKNHDILIALLYANNRGTSCITDQVSELLERAYQIAHIRAQGMEPEREITVVKTFDGEAKLFTAKIFMDSEVPTTCEAQAKDFLPSEIRVNPYDLTVFKVLFKDA
jgi:hypothetical protein